MKKFFKFISPFLTILLLIVSTSCDRSVSAKISVSIPPQAYLVERIAGNEHPVNIMIPPGSAPPSYAHTPAQLRDLHNCKLNVLLGHPDFHFENKHIRSFLSGHPEIMTVNMSDSLQLINGDIHIWLSVGNMRKAAAKIYKALIQLYPKETNGIKDNYRSLLKDIDDLDAELQETFSGREGSEFLSMHPSWTYFARDYGLIQISVHDENKSPSVKKLSTLIDHAREKDIDIIFIQKEFALEQTDVLANELNAEVIRLDPLSKDWLENMRLTGRIFRRVFDE